MMDDDPSEGDLDDLVSMRDDSFRSSTRSLTHSEYQSIPENGRTYHRYHAGKYPYPNDEPEQDRMDFQHELYLHIANQKLYLSPLPAKPGRVLDIGTGTGLWAIQFAQQHPESHVVGTDLSPIQPAYIPTNCSFEIDDAEDQWTYDRPFDFIHGRGIFPIFVDPARFIRQAYAHLKPGGWLEIQDPDYSVKFANDDGPAESAMKRWTGLMLQASIRAGRPFANSQYYKSWLEDAGFEDVTEVKFYWPTSPWPKSSHHKASAYFVKMNIRMGVVAVSLKPLTAIGMSMEEINELSAQVLKEAGDVNIKGYVTV